MSSVAYAMMCFMAEKLRDYSTYDLNFAANVKRRREEKGWTQGALADRLREHGLENYHQTTVSRVEKVERPVRIGEAWHLCEVLETPMPRMLMDPRQSDYLDALRSIGDDIDAACDALEAAVAKYLAAQTRARGQEAGYGVERPEDMDEYMLRHEATLLEYIRVRLSGGLSEAIEDAKDAFYGTDDGVDQET